MKSTLAIAALALFVAAPAQAQIQSDRLKTAPAVKTDGLKIDSSKLKIVPKPESGQAAYRERGQMQCQGKPKRWRLYPITSGRNAGKWQIHLWFDAAPVTGLAPGKCIWEEAPATWGTQEADRANGVTLEYTFEPSRMPIKSVSERNGRQTIELDRGALTADRTMRFIHDHLMSNSQSFVWAEWTPRGTGGSEEFGRIWVVKNADREHGYRFPAPLQ